MDIFREADYNINTPVVVRAIADMSTANPALRSSGNISVVIPQRSSAASWRIIIRNIKENLSISNSYVMDNRETVQKPLECLLGDLWDSRNSKRTYLAGVSTESPALMQGRQPARQIIAQSSRAGPYTWINHALKNVDWDCLI